MRKLNAYPDSAFAFYKEVVDSKKNTVTDPTYKARLNAMDALLQPLFQNYDDLFGQNELELLNAHGLTPSQREDLLRLYSYKSRVLQKLKIRLTTIELNKVLNTCQCCTIGEVGSFDHLVPKEEFPEFVVNPKNLFPSCQKCNSYKLAAWREGGVRTFLNLFLDDLPQAQYLFVVLQVGQGGMVAVSFELRNTNGIGAAVYALLASHFTKLHLLERFKENTDGVVINVVNGIKVGRAANLGKAEIVAQIRATSNANRAFFGWNYWKSVLELALADNNDFIDAIYDNP